MDERGVQAGGADPGHQLVVAKSSRNGQHLPRMQIRLQFPALPLDANERAMRAAQRDLIFGWAIACTVDGVEHYDCENTHIPEDEMLRPRSTST